MQDDVLWIIEDTEDSDAPERAQAKFLDLATVAKYIPPGSVGFWADAGGKCLSCGDTYGKKLTIVRAVTQGQGYKCCIRCSPHVADDTLRLWARAPVTWTYREKGKFV